MKGNIQVLLLCSAMLSGVLIGCASSEEATSSVAPDLKGAPPTPNPPGAGAAGAPAGPGASAAAQPN